jgi:hypothetical protein
LGLLKFFPIKKAGEGFRWDLMRGDSRFLEELVKGFVIFDFFLVGKTWVVKAIENEGEIGRKDDLLIVVVKINLLPRNDIREIHFLETEDTEEFSMLIIDEECKSVIEKEFFELIRGKIEENYFSSEKLIAIESEFDIEFDGAKPENNIERVDWNQLSFPGPKVG